MDGAKDAAHGITVNRYKLALFVLLIAVVPLFYVSIWLGLAALIAGYALTARFANKDLDRQSLKRANRRKP